MENELIRYKEALAKAAKKIQVLSDEVEKTKKADPIAVIGYSCRFPGGANNPDLFWNLLAQGRESIGEIPESRFDKDKYFSEDFDQQGKMNTKSAAFLEVPIDEFDNTHFEMSPVEVKAIDPQQRLLLEVSWEAFEHAGIDYNKIKGSKTGVFIGINSSDFVKNQALSGDLNKIGPYTLPGFAFNAASGRLAYFYDFKGPAIAVDTACSSSISALSLAIESLNKGECDMAVVGGVNILLIPETFIGLSKFSGLSKDGRCKTFDEKADGFGRGEGCGVIILQKVSQAKKDHHTIEAIVRSVYIGQDGKTNGFTATNGVSQANVIRQAMEQAGLNMNDIDYLETHGTGTSLGDIVETGALAELFQGKKKKLLIGSVKTNIGHLEAAAGMAGLIKILLSIKNKKLPPHINFETPNPGINWRDLEVVKELTDWTTDTGVRRAGLSSFGYSGTLAHAIIEEYVDTTESLEQTLPYQLLTISARTEAALKACILEMKNHIQNSKDNIYDICYSSNLCKGFMEYRYAVLGATREEILKEIEYSINDEDKFRQVTHYNSSISDPKIAFLFTGQGSIYQGIANNLYETSKVFKDSLDLCDKKFEAILNISIVDALYKKDSDTLLNDSCVSQSAIFSIEYALGCLWNSLGIRPTAVIGHSIGEYAAACYAELISLDDAVKMIAYRGKMMNLVTEHGKMVGVLASEQIVREAIEQSGCRNVSIAAVNAPNNTTISGLVNEVDTVIGEIQKVHRVFVDKLEISHPFHSIIMDQYADYYYSKIKDIRFMKPKVKIISTVTGNVETEKNMGNTEYWVRHLCKTVRYYDAIKTAEALKYNTFIEIGGNAVLSGLASQCSMNEKNLYLPSLREEGKDYKQLFDSISSLYLHGITHDWTRFYSSYKTQKVSLPAYSFQRKQFPIDIVTLEHPTHQLEIEHQTTILESVYTNSMVNEMEYEVEVKTQENVEDIIVSLKQMIHLISGLDSDEISIDKNLFHLGFDSLMLIQFKKKIDCRYTCEISLNQFLLELNTVEKIAKYIYEYGTTKVKVIEPETSIMKESHTIQSTEDYSNLGKDEYINRQFKDVYRKLEEIKFYYQTNLQKASNETGKKNAAKDINYHSSKFDEDALNDSQREFVESVIDRYSEKTKRSKDYTIKYKSDLTDWINSLNYRTTLRNLQYPIVSDHSKGARFWDLDGNEYIDIAIGYGVNFFGHNPEFIKEAIMNQLEKGYDLGPQSALAGKVAKLIKELTGVEKVAFTNTGTEAVMAALRIARAVSKKDKIVKFAGSYHGTFDGIMAETNENGAFPTSLGTPINMVSDTVSLIYGSEEAIEYIEKNQDDIAAVIVEPVQSRKPGLQPKQFLKELRELTERTGIILIFDEMVNGFRILPGGSQSYFKIHADMVTYGKIIGGGMPIGVIAGKTKYLDAIDGGTWNFDDDSQPDKETVTFAGTFCKHPLSMAAAYATLVYMKEKGENLQIALNQKTDTFCKRLNEFFESEKVPMRVNNYGSQFKIDTFGKYDTTLLPIEVELFYDLLKIKGVYTWERRTCCFCTEITSEDIDFIIDKIKETILEIRIGGFEFCEENVLPADGVKNKVFPMSISQKRLFTVIKIDNADPYHIIGAMKMKGNIDVLRLEEVFHQLIQRHDTLRTTLFIRNDQLIQEVKDSIDFKINIVRKDSSLSIDETLDGLIQVFDLENGPLIRVYLVTMEESESILLIDLHHTIADGLSLNLLAQEFMKLYSNVAISAKPKQYREYVEWEETFLGSERYEACEKFWLKQLAGELLPLELPLDYERPELPNYEGDTYHYIMDTEMVSQLKDLAIDTGSSVFMVLSSVFILLLHKITGNNEILIGTPTSSRSHGNFEESIGMFTNTTVLKNKVDPSDTYNQFLRSVKENCLETYSYMEYPFNILVNKLNVKRDVTRNPLFDVMFIYENANERVFKIGDLDIENYDYSLKQAMFDFTFEILEQNGYFNINMNYRTSLLKEETIIRWSKYFNEILRTIIEDPSILLSEIDMTTSEEKDLLLNGFNNTKTEYDRKKVIHQLFEEQVEKTPDSVAVVCQDEIVTYQELNHKSNQVARMLRNANIAKCDCVGILVDRSVDMIVAMIAILKAGAAYIPLDPEYPVERLQHIITDSGLKIILSQKELIDSNQYNVRFIDIQSGELNEFDGSNVDNVNEEQDLAYVIYTSGSTGKPKGVMIHHQAVHNFIVGMCKEIEFKEEKSILSLTTNCFDIFMLETILPLVKGMKTVIASNQEQLDVEKISKLIHEHDIDMIQSTPSRMKLLLSHTTDYSWLGRLSDVLIGGEAFPMNLLKRMKQLTNARIFNMYGPTEVTIWCSTKELTNMEAITIGLPICNIDMHVLNQNLKLCPIGSVGELYIGGDGVSKGYLNRPELTTERFIEDPYHKGKVIYRTGDLVRRLDNGEIVFCNRNDFQVKIRGYRIELEEIEKRINEYEGIRESVIKQIDDEENNKCLCAYYTADSEISINILSEHLAKTLPQYMIPRYFMHLEVLPYTLNGKIDLNKLPKPSGQRPVLSNQFEIASTIDEKFISEIWKDVLKIDKVGIHDNFFDLGGTSNELLIVYYKMKDYFKIEFSTVILFQYPTIRQLINYIYQSESKVKQEDKETQDRFEKTKNILYKTMGKVRKR